MATIPGFQSFEYREADRGNPSPRAYYTADSLRLVRDILVRPVNATGMKANYDAAKAFLGFPALVTVRLPIVGTVWYRYVKRFLPNVATWTDFPNALIAVGVENQQGVPPGVRTAGEAPWNDALAVNEYAESQMTVEYRSTNYDVKEDFACVSDPNSVPGKNIPGFFQRNGRGDFPDEGLMLRYIDRPEWNFSSKVTALPVGITSVFPDAGDGWPAAVPSLPTKKGIPIREPLMELTYIHRELPLGAVPVTTIQTSLGCMNGVYINDADPTDPVNNFDAPYWNIPPYCGLFVGAKPHVCKLITGEVGVNMEYKILVAPNVVRYGANAGQFGGWRRVLDVIPSAQGKAGPLADYRQLYAVFNNQKNADPLQYVINTADFSKLFRPPQT